MNSRPLGFWSGVLRESDGTPSSKRVLGVITGLTAAGLFVVDAITGQALAAAVGAAGVSCTYLGISAGEKISSIRSQRSGADRR